MAVDLDTCSNSSKKSAVDAFFENSPHTQQQIVLKWLKIHLDGNNDTKLVINQSVGSSAARCG